MTKQCPRCDVRIDQTHDNFEFTYCRPCRDDYEFVRMDEVTQRDMEIDCCVNPFAYTMRVKSIHAAKIRISRARK